MGLGMYCNAVPPQLGAESDRGACPAPVMCDCRVSLPKSSLVLPSPCKLFHTHQWNPKFRTVLAGPGAYTSWSGPLHTCTILSVSLSSQPPHFVPCSLTSRFFFPLSSPLCPSFKIFWWIQTLFLGDTRTLLLRCHPPIISPTSFPTFPSLQAGPCPRASLSPSHFSFFPKPFSD